QGRYPNGAQVIDLSQHTVVPGLVDCHAHLVGELEQGEYDRFVMRTGAQEALTGVRNARDTVMAGFTTVRDVGTFRAFVDVALRDAITAGTRTGPRMAVAGGEVTVPAARWPGPGGTGPRPGAAGRPPASPPTPSCRSTSASGRRPRRRRSGGGSGRSC